MITKLKLLVLFFFVFSGQCYSQIQKDVQTDSWWTYSGNHKITDKWSVHTLYSFRRSDFISHWQQSLLRVGLNYTINDNFIVAPGYDWVITFPYGKQPIAEQVTEHRFYEQFIVKNKIGRASVNNRYRFEQRLFNDVPTRYRARFLIGVDVPISHKTLINHTLFVSLFNEAFVNIGNVANTRYFDQNWAYAGVGYKVNTECTLKLGYMNQYIPKADGLRVESNNTFCFDIIYGLDLTKNGK